MQPSDDARPTEPEVDRQLKRMLANPLFTARPTQARVFDYLVRSALEGKEVTEKDLRARFFPSPPYKPESTVARTTVNFIRTQLLKDYYGGEGKDDPVVIALPDPQKNKNSKGQPLKAPPGKAYRPRFSHNPRHPIAKEYKLGVHFLQRGYASEMVKAAQHFYNVVALEPAHAGALFGMAEALCAYSLFDRVEMRSDLLTTAEELVQRAEALTADTCQIHAIRAAICYCKNKLDQAQKEFDVALEINSERVSRYPWYSYFLLATAKEDEVLQFAKSVVDEHIDDAGVYGFYAGHLQSAKRFDEAESVLKEALEIDRNCWIAHLMMARLCISSGRKKQAQLHFNRMESLLERGDYKHLISRLKLNKQSE